ncbi:MAG: hypothetical protein QT12_C0020G0001, partial [archaeon GW2011_AR21]
QEAKKGMEVAISINDAVCGRNLFEEDELYSLIPKEQFAEIQKLKECFTQAELELAEEIREKQKKIKA